MDGYTAQIKQCLATMKYCTVEMSRHAAGMDRCMVEMTGHAEKTSGCMAGGIMRFIITISLLLFCTSLFSQDKPWLIDDAPQNNSPSKKAKKVRKGGAAQVVPGVGVFSNKDAKFEGEYTKVVAKGATGAAFIYALDEKRHAKSLFSTAENGTRSSFYVNIGNKALRLTNIKHPNKVRKIVRSKGAESVYKMTGNSYVATGARSIENGVSLIYVIPKKVRLRVDYELYQSDEAGQPSTEQDMAVAQASFQEAETEQPPEILLKSDPNAKDRNKATVVRVTATMENYSNSTNIFSLKEVLDTYWGEAAGIHFSTNSNKYITSEVYFDNFDWTGEKSFVTQECTNWVATYTPPITGFPKYTMKVATAGRGVDTIISVLLGSRDNLSQKEWYSSKRIGRDFDTKQNYLDSAMSIYWPGRRLGPGEKFAVSYYVALEVLDYFNSEDFIAGLTAPEKKSPVALPPPPKVELPKEPEIPTVDVDLNFSDDGSGRFVFDESTITSDKLNYEYVQSLIDRINTIENDSEDNLDHNELLRLNAEIDIILKRLQRRGGN